MGHEKHSCIIRKPMKSIRDIGAEESVIKRRFGLIYQNDILLLRLFKFVHKHIFRTLSAR